MWANIFHKAFTPFFARDVLVFSCKSESVRSAIISYDDDALAFFCLLACASGSMVYLFVDRASWSVQGASNNHTIRVKVHLEEPTVC